MAQAGAGGFFDDAGFPAGDGWDLIELPVSTGGNAYALQVQGDSMLPVYRDRDMLIVEPGATVRKGDRVVVKTKTARSWPRSCRAATRARSNSVDQPRTSRPPDCNVEVEWLARIVWASQ